MTRLTQPVIPSLLSLFITTSSIISTLTSTSSHFVCAFHTLPFSITGSKTIRSITCNEKFLLQSTNNSNNDKDDDSSEPIFYNDFEEFLPGSSISSDNISNSSNSDDKSSTFSPSSQSSNPPTSENTSDNDNDKFDYNSQLSKLLSQSKQKDVEDDVRLARNWSSGNWKVRGFSLDNYNPNDDMDRKLQKEQQNEQQKDGGVKQNDDDRRNIMKNRFESKMTLKEKFENMKKKSDDSEEDKNKDDKSGGQTQSKQTLSSFLSQQPSSSRTKTTTTPVHVSKIVFDETVLGFSDVTESIAVGRTDGSVYIIQLGSDYMTRFTTISKEEIGADNDSDDGFDLLKSQTELIRDEEDNSLSSTTRQQQQQQTEGKRQMMDEELLSTPFEVVHQFQENDVGEEISSLLYHDETLYTASGTSGEIKVWSFDDSLSTMSFDDSYNKRNKLGTIPILNLKHGHNDKVVAMKTLSNNVTGEKVDVNDHNLLLSASLDGSFALWSRDDGDLVYRCQLMDDYGNPTSITCADVDTSADEHFIYFGLSSGHVVAYAVSDLVGCASVGNSCPIPSSRFIVHDPSQQKIENETTLPGVSAITCAGEGTSALTTKSISNFRSTMVLVGGADGIVKQYEVLRRKQSSDDDNNSDLPAWKLEHWPRLPTQRMKRHAHIFKGHFGSVTALASQSGSKILSAGSDGTIRVWDPSKGKELYRMDGFDETISNLCLDREILVTDGMANFVCVHDFDVSIDEYKDGFDLDW